MIEVCHGIQPVPQPSPSRTGIGDCFCCALTAAVNHLWPELDVGFDEMFALHERNYANSEKTYTDMVWGSAQRTMYKLRDARDVEFDAFFDLVVPSFERPETWTYAWWMFEPTTEWARRLEGFLRAGYVAFAEVLFAGGGPLNADLKRYSPDHAVLIDGVRLGWEAGEHGSHFTEYAHVVCSVKGGYWINVRDLMRHHGTAGLWLLRRGDELR